MGGSGFVGRNLARRLQAQGREVFVLDRVPGPVGSVAGTFISGDAQNADLVLDVLTKIRPAVVYHLAANSDIASGVTDASLDFGDTLMTTIAVRNAVAEVGVDQLVFASSSAIFGMSDKPLDETPETLPMPVSWYGKAKLASEYVLESLSAEKPSLPILIVRFPNVVGPLATHGVVFDFVQKLRQNPIRLDVLGDGNQPNQTKPYIHVAELIDGIQHFEQAIEPGITRINVGPPDMIDVKGIVEEVCAALTTKPQVTYQESPYGWPGNVPRYEYDVSKMQRAGFATTMTSREAVRLAIEELVRELADQ